MEYYFNIIPDNKKHVPIGPFRHLIDMHIAMNSVLKISNNKVGIEVDPDHQIPLHDGSSEYFIDFKKKQ